MDWADRIGRRIRLRDLHILLAVAERGSMSKASAHLSVSHPVVSKTISDLEHTLGVRLLDRSSQGVQLTNYGRALLKCGMTVFDEMRQGLKQIEFLADPTSGELRMGCAEVTMAGLLPEVVEHFSRKYPRIRLHVILANTAMLQFQELRGRNVELLLGRMPRPFLEDDLIAEMLLRSPLSRLLEFTADGLAVDVSSLPSSSNSRGCCRPMTACLAYLSPGFFVPAISNLRS